MKKIFSLIIIIISFIFIVSCSKDNTSGKYEIALITEGSIDDKSFNQGAWEGLTQYAKENGKTYKYYQPTQKTTDGYIDSIDLAVSTGAKLVITPNYLFETAIYKAQDIYTNVHFILIDGTPQDGTYTDFRIEKNVYSVLYAEE
ncbi:BMP family ABC transporter substrate-binding protein, partial [Brachyspira hampsonii]